MNYFIIKIAIKIENYKGIFVNRQLALKILTHKHKLFNNFKNITGIIFSIMEILPNRYFKNNFSMRTRRANRLGETFSRCFHSRTCLPCSFMFSTCVCVFRCNTRVRYARRSYVHARRSRMLSSNIESSRQVGSPLLNIYTRTRRYGVVCTTHTCAQPGTLATYTRTRDASRR